MQPVPQPVSLNMPLYDAKDPEVPPYAPPYAYPKGAPASAPPPRDYVLWSLFNTMFLNACCLGFVALVFSFKSRDRKVVGDAEGATSYSKTAKGLNIAALILSILFYIVVIILIATGAIVVRQVMEQQQQQNTLDDYFRRQGK